MMGDMTTALIPDWTLGDRLAKARETAGVTVQEMADHLAVSRNTVSNYEHGRTRVTRAVVFAYADLTGVSVQWLLTGTVPNADTDAVTDGYLTTASPEAFRWALDHHAEPEVDDAAVTRAILAAVPEMDRRHRSTVPPRGRWERADDALGVALQFEVAA